MEETLKSLSDLPDVGTVQESEQNNQQEQRPLSKYAAKQRRRLPQQDRQQPHHEIRRSAQLQDTEKWMAVVRLATSLDQISAKVENIENRLNALVVPEAQPLVDMEALRKNLWDDFSKQANCTVNLVTVRMEEQAQDLRNRQKEIQTQITNEVTAAHERINSRLSDLVADAVDSRDLLRVQKAEVSDLKELFREVLRRLGDPADTAISQRLREVQYLVKQLELQREKEEAENNAPQDRKHWLPRWACQLLFGSDVVHVTDHGVWAEISVADKTESYGATTVAQLFHKLRAARKAYKVQQKIAALQAKLNQNTAAK